ncbi:Oidioi.mRNA.OKI2018_I69.chr1.g509.t1.cds [Oikopleura dioica]|uniref:Oidioi.mRNA.OKI2018_I69.chr1.g509.t1.cds n=1 Tax=Oikopleura dioica TaxID=34765 RepID=A0ABN7SPH1_OIKDI|nr:Oidioi.mRNA.OKI2018_I69.chr1.g509.t1.cds [Oikopleura dioica]
MKRDTSLKDFSKISESNLTETTPAKFEPPSFLLEDYKNLKIENAAIKSSRKSERKRARRIIITLSLIICIAASSIITIFVIYGKSVIDGIHLGDATIKEEFDEQKTRLITLENFHQNLIDRDDQANQILKAVQEATLENLGTIINLQTEINVVHKKLDILYSCLSNGGCPQTLLPIWTFSETTTSATTTPTESPETIPTLETITCSAANRVNNSVVIFVMLLVNSLE